MAPKDTARYLAEAHGTYAAGLLALALSAEHVADDAVRSGTVVPLARYLRRSCGFSLALEEGSTLVPDISPAEGATVVEQPSTGRRGLRRPRSDRVGSIDASAVAALPLIRADSDGATVLWADLGDDDGVVIEVEDLEYSTRHGSAEHYHEELRSRREVYAVQAVGCLGEYLECVAPLMQARRLRLMRPVADLGSLCVKPASQQVNGVRAARCFIE